MPPDPSSSAPDSSKNANTSLNSVVSDSETLERLHAEFLLKNSYHHTLLTSYRKANAEFVRSITGKFSECRVLTNVEGRSAPVMMTRNEEWATSLTRVLDAAAIEVMEKALNRVDQSGHVSYDVSLKPEVIKGSQMPLMLSYDFVANTSSVHSSGRREAGSTPCNSVTVVTMMIREPGRVGQWTPFKVMASDLQADRQALARKQWEEAQYGHFARIADQIKRTTQAHRSWLYDSMEYTLQDPGVTARDVIREKQRMLSDLMASLQGELGDVCRRIIEKQDPPDSVHPHTHRFALEYFGKDISNEGPRFLFSLRSLAIPRSLPDERPRGNPEVELESTVLYIQHQSSEEAFTGTWKTKVSLSTQLHEEARGRAQNVDGLKVRRMLHQLFVDIVQ